MESLRVTVPEIWPGQNHGGKKRNKKKKKRKKNERAQSHIASLRGSLIKNRKYLLDKEEKEAEEEREKKEKCGIRQ